MAYEIQLKSSEAEVVDADGYTQEGVLTTFFPRARRARPARLLGKANRQLPHGRHHPYPLDGIGRRPANRTGRPNDHAAQGKLSVAAAPVVWWAKRATPTFGPRDSALR